MSVLTMSVLTRALVLCVVLVFAAGEAPAQQGTTRVTLVHFNDTDQMLPRDGSGGLAEAMTLIRRLRADNPATVLTFGGDMFSPSLMSGFDKGAHMVALTSAMGIDVAVLGNHEFDFGPDVAAARLAESTYPWLAANVTRDGAAMTGTSPSLVREVGGVRIGFFGITTERSAETTSAGPSVTFGDAIAAARREAAALRERGAEIVVGLCHLELRRELELLRAVPQVDICLSGDDHIGLVFYDGKQMSIEAGSNLSFLAVVDLHLTRPASGERTRVTWRPEPRLVPTAGVAADPELAAKVKRYAEQLDSSLDVRIGTAGAELDSRRATVRMREAAFGNLLADAMRAATGADVAVTNGGGIRADKVCPAGHALTRRDILSELPFGNLVVLIELTGQQIRAALENGVSQVEQAAGRFPQVSGLSFVYDGAAPAGSRVGEITVGGKPLEPATTYKLATNDFLARGGDGYTVFRSATPLVDEKRGRLMATVLIDYIEAAGAATAAVEGRIRQR